MDGSIQSNLVNLSGLVLKAYHADGAVMLAFDLDQSLTPGLAGFAIQVTQPDGSAHYLPNRLDFTSPVTNQTAPGEEPEAPSNQAPFQKFSWVYYPAEVMPGTYTYTVTAMYFNPDNSLNPGPAASISLALTPIQNGPLQIGFTRGFFSSQAYASKFDNQPFEPAKKSIDFDTTPYQKQYRWLGARAREMMFEFLAECLSDPTITLDVFAYDLDEPDIIHQLVQMGGRLHAVLDNCSPLHTAPTSMEPLARQALEQSAGNGNIKVGHFDRFSHSKVLIQKKNGVPVKVLAGSANFSIRGLYVQANNVFIFDDPVMAGHYEDAFQTAFNNMTGFRQAPISQQWFDLPAAGCPPYSACFSPHTDYHLSMDKVAGAIQNAQSSVLFAVMEMAGGGDVMKDLLGLETRPNLFSYGITQSSAGIGLYKPGSPNAVLTTFAALDSQVPPPFNKEWNGGMGQVIHHKFVVVDFNGPNPALFTGSSNLSSGGETDNGDNLVAIYDPVVVQAYAVEAIRLVDHYHFRANEAKATAANPLTLQGTVAPGQEWWQPYYNPEDIKCLERTLFVS